MNEDGGWPPAGRCRLVDGATDERVGRMLAADSAQAQDDLAARAQAQCAQGGRLPTGAASAGSG